MKTWGQTWLVRLIWFTSLDRTALLLLIALALWISNAGANEFGNARFMYMS
jgi:hypothetical protein